jgi:hypothetical protein
MKGTAMGDGQSANDGRLAEGLATIASKSSYAQAAAAATSNEQDVVMNGADGDADGDGGADEDKEEEGARARSAVPQRPLGRYGTAPPLEVRRRYEQGVRWKRLPCKRTYRYHLWLHCRSSKAEVRVLYGRVVPLVPPGPQVCPPRPARRKRKGQFGPWPLGAGCSHLPPHIA